MSASASENKDSTPIQGPAFAKGPFCGVCKKSKKDGGDSKLMTCSQCKIAKYCSRDCQLQANIKKPLVLWSSPWYKWPALNSRIFWNSYTSNESALQAISNFQKIRQKTMVNSILLKYAFYIVNSANFRKFVKSMQVICTRDSTKVLKASLCLFENCSDLLWEKIVLVIEKTFSNSRL